QPTLSFDIKTVNNVNDQDSKLLHSTETVNNISQEQKSITNSTENLTLVSDFVQGLLQEFTSHNNQCWESVEIPNPTSVSESLQKLAHLFHKASIARKNSINTKREEILSWGRYSERYEDKAIELRSENKNLTDKSARNRIYNEMKPYLSGISDGYLRVMTCKARKINKLFGYEYDP
ncbi:4512_t:CDS:1, partial [Diversispora eburnea]